MLGECCVEFGNIALSSSEDNTGRSLIVNGVFPSESSSLEFIGNVFDFCGQSGKSAEHRQHEANGMFRR